MTKELFDDLNVLELRLSSKNKIPHKLIYLGSENHLYERLIKQYKEIIHAENSLLEKISLNGLEVSPSQFYTELFTVPLFFSNRIVIVRHADSLFKNIEINSTILKHFNKKFNHLPKSIFCFLQFDSSSLPKNFSKLKESDVIFKPNLPKGHNIILYYIKEAKKMGYEIDKEALELLLSKCAFDFHKTHQALKQLTLYLLPQCNQKTLNKNKITLEMIEDFCEKSEGNFYFQLLDQIAEKRISDCIQKFNQHKFNDGTDLSISFTKLFIDAYRYQYFIKLGISHSEILIRLGIKKAHPFMIKKNEQRYQKLLQNYQEKSYPFILKALSKLDKILKIEPKEKHRNSLIMFIASLEGY